MEKVEKDQIKQTIKTWIRTVNHMEILPNEIVALNFGLYEPYGIELTGSTEYDPENDDWACNEDFIPEQRYCPNFEISDNLD